MKTLDDIYFLKIKDYGSVIEQSYYKHHTISKINSSSEEEKARSSRSRAISKIKEICYCNSFDYFFTLTIKDISRYDIESSINSITKSINYYKKLAKLRNLDFKFIYIFELTKKGGVHLHGFFSGFYDLYLNEYNHLSSLYFDNIGFQNFIKASDVNVNYLIKYILKSPTYVKQIYHCSRGLEKPTITIYHDYFDNFLDFPFTFKSKYCKMITY